jgi:hypothetical protein
MRWPRALRSICRSSWQDALLVAQEEVLDMGAFELAAQGLGLVHGVDRRVLEALGGDAQRLEAVEQVPGGGRHRAVREAAFAFGPRGGAVLRIFAHEGRLRRPNQTARA